MQIKIISVSVVGGEDIQEELNTFLRSRKILQVEQQLVQQKDGAYWTFCIRYIDDQRRSTTAGRKRKRIDYKEELSPEVFARFAQLRAIRKTLAQEEAVPAFVIFTDEELAHFARLEKLTPESMKKVKGIGVKKMEKYAQRFIQSMQDEESE